MSFIEDRPEEERINNPRTLYVTDPDHKIPYWTSFPARAKFNEGYQETEDENFIYVYLCFPHYQTPEVEAQKYRGAIHTELEELLKRRVRYVACQRSQSVDFNRKVLAVMVFEKV